MKRKHCECCHDICDSCTGSSSKRRKLGDCNDQPPKAEPGDSNNCLERILVEQPLRRLAQYQMVSRQWKALIGQPTFQQFLAEKSEANSLFVSYLKTDMVGIVRLIHNRYSVTNYRLPPSRSALPLKNVLGSCYGLVCLGNTSQGGYRAEEDILLLNPCTKKMRLIKDTIHCGLERGHYGLGFDRKAQDFKIAKVCTPLVRHSKKKLTPKREAEMVHIIIYSWKYSCWRETYFEDWGFNLVHYPGMFLDGKIYWPGKVWEMQGIFVRPQGHQNSLVSFDVSSETLGCINLPEDLQSEYCSFGVVAGTLTACVCGEKTEVWQYIENNFRKRASLSSYRNHMSSHLQPLYQLGNLMVLLHNGRKVTLYDMSDHSKLHALGLDKWVHQGAFKRRGPRMEAVPLVESLFSPTFETEKANCE
ncbi:F-box/kelch-repeat protein At3g23880-like [Rosa rugosa]|uniref:F-box/kelch-repeat protein At3g23880-like n=1 Tax=Rosa rugosa TaxID=74645 RepID=UPI002B4117E6|nr:F-box/kelch-repeat protein At3g23880-like [Rosa rugosa]XP_062013890.1 F-box/kelch-repeat protein At3g23880-like [Rosa rugosa]